MKKLLITLMIIFFGTQSLVPVFAQGNPADANFRFDLNTITHEDLQEGDYVRGGINFVFTRMINILAATAGSAAILTIVIGGFMIMVSNGAQELIDRGKNMIKKAIFGLVFIFGAYIIVTTIQLLITTIL